MPDTASVTPTGLPPQQAIEDSRDRTAPPPPRRLPRHPGSFPPLARGRHARDGITAEQVADIQRGKICGAMMLCLAEHDYESVHMSELAECAGVSLQDLYRRFKHGKDEIFLTVFDQVAHASLDRLRLAGDHSDSGARLRARTIEFVHAVCDQPAAARVLLIEPFALGAPAVARMRTHQQRLEQMLSVDLEALGGSPPLIAKGIVAGVARLARQALTDGHLQQLAGRAEQIADWACCLACARGGSPATVTVRPFRPTEPLRSAGRVYENRREWVLAAALNVLEQRGYLLLSDREVRRQAEVSCRELAAQFADEQEIFTAILEQLWHSALGYALRSGSAGAGDWPQLVAGTICRLIGSFTADQLFARIACQELTAAGAAGLALRERLTADIASRLAASAPAGRRMSDTAAQASIAACWAILSHRILEGQSELLATEAPLLAFIATAPAIGPHAAAQALGMPTPQSPAQGAAR